MSTAPVAGRRLSAVAVSKVKNSGKQRTASLLFHPRIIRKPRISAANERLLAVISME